MRVRGLFAFGALGVLGLACYSGLSSLEPFPCASDGTCPNGLLCINDQCVCPTMCGQTCVNTSNDANNCGACGATCGTTCSGGACQNLCTLFGTDCSGGTCLLDITGTLWGTTCRTLGTAQIGAACNPPGNDCVAGSVCLAQMGVDWCWQLCDDTHPCPGTETCNENSSIPNGGGYCTTPSNCGEPFTVQCSGSAGSYTCPTNSMCTSTTSDPKECTCSTGFTGYNCQNETCASVGGCTAGTPWWCN